jgi:hypothetical protein
MAAKDGVRGEPWKQELNGASNRSVVVRRIDVTELHWLMQSRKVLETVAPVGYDIASSELVNVFEKCGEHVAFGREFDRAMIGALRRASKPCIDGMNGLWEALVGQCHRALPFPTTDLQNEAALTLALRNQALDRPELLIRVPIFMKHDDIPSTYRLFELPNTARE